MPHKLLWWKLRETQRMEELRKRRMDAIAGLIGYTTLFLAGMAFQWMLADVSVQADMQRFNRQFSQAHPSPAAAMADFTPGWYDAGAINESRRRVCARCHTGKAFEKRMAQLWPVP